MPETKVADSIYTRVFHSRDFFAIIVLRQLEKFRGAGVDAIPASITFVRVNDNIVFARSIRISVICSHEIPSSVEGYARSLLFSCLSFANNAAPIAPTI